MDNKNKIYGISGTIRHLSKFASFVFYNFPSARVALAVAVSGVFLEYMALTVMIPLAMAGGHHSQRGQAVVNFWHGFADGLGLPSEPRTWLWLFLLLLGLRVSIGFVQLGLNTWVSKQIHAYLSGGTFSRVVVSESLSEIYRRTVGYYTALAGDEAVRIGQVFFHIIQMLSALMAAIIGLAVLYTFSSLVFNLTLLFLILSGLAISVTTKYVFNWSNEAVLVGREATTTFVEAFNGIRSIRSMGGESFVSQRYRNFINRYARVLFFLDVFNHGSRSLPGLILIVMGLAVLFPGVNILGKFSVVYFFTVTTMLVRVLSFLGTVVASGGRAAIDIRAAFDLGDVIGPKHSIQVNASQDLSTVRHVKLSNISCGYIQGHPVLSEVTIEMHAGKVYVLVGRSGSGKSTLTDVFLGLLPPISGEIVISGQSYEKIDMASLRRRVVLMEQQTRIFSGSVRENIAFGLKLTDSDLHRAIKASGLDDFIDELPDGLESCLDYQGANLSGGQRQRIGLARAIVRQPDVLILDEATSALDAQTRDQVLDSLKEMFHERILLFVTHDHHVIDQADEVWHIRKGKLIVERKVDDEP